MTVKTLLIGKGPTLGRVADDLLELGAAVSATTTEQDPGPAGLPPTVEALSATAIRKCRYAGDGYDLTLATGDETVHRRAACIVLCDEYHREPLLRQYGLTAGRHVQSLSQVEPAREKDEGDVGAVAFITGIMHESNPLTCREVMQKACRFAENGRKVYILTGNLKVAAQGLEALYRTAREAGVVFIKFNQEAPAFSQSDDGTAVITFRDEITGHRFRLTPSLTVVDEMLSASAQTVDTAAALGVEGDPTGFAQTDNVHRLPVRTNRRGILAVGPSRGVMSPEQQSMDISNAALECLGLENKGWAPSPRAEITAGCVRCLTCLRSCPFGAVAFNGSVRIIPFLCEGCGICVAECPQKAIQLQHLPDGSPGEQLAEINAAGAEAATRPAIYVFCCSRSAAQAAELARLMRYRLPAGLKIIRVPCTGLVATGDILKAFQEKADGVMVLACHQDNCHGERGNLNARRRSEAAMNLLTQVGLAKERLQYATLAANMAWEFSAAVNGFAAMLKQLGAATSKKDPNVTDTKQG